MNEFIYQTLTKFGYSHPLHPTIAHLPVGLVAAAFLFGLIAFFLRHSAMAQTAQHCIILALISLIPTMILGYWDWQQFYAGSLLSPIRMKIILAISLLLLLIIAVYWGIKTPKGLKTIVVYTLCLVAVIGLGYYGGELVYGKRPEPVSEKTDSTQDDTVKVGEMAFNQHCLGCHFVDRTDFKMGPGLKGLFNNEKLYKSNWPVNEANVRKQIVEPFGTMPAYNDLSDETLDAILTYLKTL